jgi:homoserine kinase
MIAPDARADAAMPPAPAARSTVLPAGVRAGELRVRVPASSANLGPGFDCLGLSLALYDRLDVEALPSGLLIEVDGAGAAEVPRGEDHLVVQAIRAGLRHAGVEQPGLSLRCHNVIPHGRGLGSSASAVVAGLVAARGLLEDPSLLDDATVLVLADRFEGHPDNVAASVYGGFTVSWVDAQSREARAVSLGVHPEIVPIACVPGEELATSKARAMLPREVPHADAAFTAGRAALIVEAMTRRPELLLAATDERLHQQQRGPAMPASLGLLHRLRERGLAAVVSGAGPTVLVLGVGQASVGLVEAEAAADGAGAWRIVTPGIDLGGTTVVEA